MPQCRSSPSLTCGRKFRSDLHQLRDAKLDNPVTVSKLG